MRPVEGTVTDRATMQAFGLESPEAKKSLGFGLTLDDYQAGAAETAIYPRVYTEDQVRDMLRVASRYMDPGFTDEEIDNLLADFETPFNGLVYPLLGLAGEVGEILNKAKKIARDQGGQMDLTAVEDTQKELGDSCWYVARIASELDASLGDVAQANLDKLRSRAERGVLGGSGDNR